MSNTSSMQAFCPLQTGPYAWHQDPLEGTAAGLDLPGAAAEDGDLVALPGDAGDVDVIAADHEVDVDRAPVDLVHVLCAHRDLVGVAERNVARRVLIEKRVVESRAKPPDPAFAVDEGDLAEPGGIRIVRGALA